MRIDPSDLRGRDRYRLLISAIVPRPIAFVTTRGADGLVNLAPFSFFQGVSASPPTVSLAVSRKRDGSPKDTWRNIET
ncbi:MAG: flavin reductase, partial [Acidobacteriota bacterium]